MIESVHGSKRLLAITRAVEPRFVKDINRIDWLSRAWEPEDEYYRNPTFRRRILEPCDLTRAIDESVQQLVPEINRLCNQTYRQADGQWQICEPDYLCPMHTDGHKPNVMIIYWQTPGPEFGTTFYNSTDPADVFHEFPGMPNTGFFANYKPRIGRPWPEMWHASLIPVPINSYRLITQYELVKS